MISTFTFAANTIGFMITKEYDKENAKEMRNAILEKIAVFDKINLYIEDDNIESVSLKIVAQEILFKLEISSSLKKIAIVTDRDWIHTLTSIENFISSAKIRNFKSKQRLEAIQWISQ